MSASPGDVFRLPGRPELYLAEALTPGGALYARRYDLYIGTYGEPLAFPPDTPVEVLFSSRGAEDEPGWSCCEIAHRAQYEDAWSGLEWFEAEGVGPEGRFSAGRSIPRRFVRGEPMLAMGTESNRAIHRRLLEALIAEGWEPVMERRLAWYAMRLRRRAKE